MDYKKITTCINFCIIFPNTIRNISFEISILFRNKQVETEINEYEYNTEDEDSNYKPSNKSANNLKIKEKHNINECMNELLGYVVIKYYISTICIPFLTQIYF